MYGLSVADKSVNSVNFGYFSVEQNFLTRDVSHPFCGSATKVANVGVWPIDAYSLNFVNFGPGAP